MPKPLYVNPLLRTDSYKLTHWRQYPPDTEIVYSYLESRGGMFDATLMAGLQYYLRAYFEGAVFKGGDIDEAIDQSREHFGNDRCFNADGWYRLLGKWGGLLPLRIKAVAEGTVVEGHNALVTIENTDPEFPWLTNWAETLLLKVWYPITVATLSYNIKLGLAKALERTGDPADLLWKLHDFGYRGVSSEEGAAIGGFAHLINFRGTDTQAALALARQYYASPMAGFSIPASEHSTITSWGGPANEVDAYRNLLAQFPDGLVACVSDSYDIRNAVEHLWGGVLRDEVNARVGTLVVRPDSGDPVTVLDDVLTALESRFGLDDTHLGTRKGYKVLSPRVRVIQGDGVNFHTIANITSQLTRKGWSQSNWGYGMGGALLQQLNRDTLRFAFKCSAVRRGGVWHHVAKDPITDPTKRSRGGRFLLVNNGETHRTLTLDTGGPEVQGDLLDTVFLDGDVRRTQSLDDIRTRSER